MPIDNKHYAAFLLNVEEITDLKNNLIQMNLDFRTAVKDPYTLDEISDKEVYVEDYQALKSNYIYLKKN